MFTVKICLLLVFVLFNIQVNGVFNIVTQITEDSVKARGKQIVESLYSIFCD